MKEGEPGEVEAVKEGEGPWRKNRDVVVTQQTTRNETCNKKQE